MDILKKKQQQRISNIMKSGSHKRAMKGERKNEREMERKLPSHHSQLLFFLLPSTLSTCA